MYELSNEELIARFRSERDEYEKELLKDQFFKQNRKLPYHLARKLRTVQVPVEDVVGIANVGLVVAFNTFKLDAEVKFVTYAYKIMYNEILRYFKRDKRHWDKLSLEASLSTDSSDEEFNFLELIPDESKFEEALESSQFVAEVVDISNEILNDRERFVLFNLLRDKPYSHQVLGNRLGCSKAYVGRLLKNGAKKIRTYFEENEFEH